MNYLIYNNPPPFNLFFILFHPFGEPLTVSLRIGGRGMARDKTLTPALSRPTGEGE